MAHDPDRTAIEAAARAISDGGSLPSWVQNASEPLRSQLVAVAEIGRFHREALDATDPSATIGAPPPTSKGKVTSTWMHFHLFEAIGHGTSGEVYRAWDSHMAREVALKLRVTGTNESAPMVLEARRLAQVRHPQFVVVHGIARAEGCVGTWMELLRGRTLLDLVREHGPLSANEAALAGAEVCSALAAVHQAGLLHRDVKPQNVIRESAGRIVLLDLSASRDTDQPTADLAGTPAYLAPELFAGSPATVASDIYAAGALLFFLTTGSTPIDATSVDGIRRAHERGTARKLRDQRPDLPRPFVEIVERALARKPSDRFATAGELEVALTGLLARRGTVTVREARQGRPLRLGVTVLWVLGAALVASLATSLLRQPAQAGSGGGTETPIIAPEQLKVARAIEELGASLAEQGNWRAARDQFLEAEQVYRISTGADAPLVARAVMHVAWAEQQMGNLDAAARQYELATAKFQQFDLQPMISAVQTALADVLHRAGRPGAAAQALGEAIESRARTLGLEPRTSPHGLARLGLTISDLQKALATWRAGQDQDADGLPDALEGSVGLRPDARDSDRDGLADGLEDHDSDGLTNELEFGLPLNPTGVIVQYGANDPELLGFQQPANRRQTGQPSQGPGDSAWRANAHQVQMYFWPLSRTQRTAALTRGWRLSTRGAGGVGAAFSDLDLGPEGPRFDLEFEADDTGWFLERNTSVVPNAGIRDRLSTNPDWGLVELEYSPRSQSATLLVQGKPSASPPSTGHHQFREDVGVFFGAWNRDNIQPRAHADFRLVMLVVR